MEKNGLHYPKVGNKLQRITSEASHKQHNKLFEIFLLLFCETKSNFGVHSWQAIKRITSCSENRGLVSIRIFYTIRQHNPRVTLCLSAEEVGAMISRDQWAVHKYSKWFGNSSEASRSPLKKELKLALNSHWHGVDKYLCTNIYVLQFLNISLLMINELHSTLLIIHQK